jgi:hypothetical protein
MAPQFVTSDIVAWKGITFLLIPVQKAVYRYPNLTSMLFQIDLAQILRKWSMWWMISQEEQWLTWSLFAITMMIILPLSKTSTQTSMYPSIVVDRIIIVLCQWYSAISEHVNPFAHVSLQQEAVTVLCW